MTENLRPRPVVIPSTEPYWNASDEGRLDLPVNGGSWEPYPRPGARGDVEWRTASPTGVVHTFSISRFSPYTDLEAPYVVALVDLDEGPRIYTNLVDVEPAEVVIGMRVEVTFLELDDRMLPVFRPAVS